MKISIKAKPGAREEKIEKIGENDFAVSVKELPVKGQANEAIVRVLADYFQVSRSSVRIISGWTSRQKVISINE